MTEGATAKPLCIDIGHGKGGWMRAFLDAGYRVIGYDIKRFKDYSGESILQDVRTIDGTLLRRLRPRAIVASMPCQKFSNYNSRTRDPEEGMVLVRAAMRVIREAEPDYWAMENVRSSVKYISRELGPPAVRNQPWYVWGNFPGFLLPRSDRFYKGQLREPRRITFKKGAAAGVTKTVYRWGWPGAETAAMIPYPLARSLAEACLP